MNNRLDFSVFKIDKKILLIKILLSFAAVILIGAAISFNNLSGLGNDPISVFLDGVRNTIKNISPVNDIDDLAVATNLILVIFFVFIFFVSRKYINIGTLIYTFFLGIAILIGIELYFFLGFNLGNQDTVNLIESIFGRANIKISEYIPQIIASAIACLMLFIGGAIFISLNIGLDPFTSLIMIVRDKTKKSFRIIKIVTDMGFLILGWILGGKVGIVTIVCAICAGPCINKFVDLLKNTNLKVFDSN